jgi:hypothetical protein
MEPHRAPVVQCHQQQRGRQATGSLEAIVSYIRTTTTTTGLRAEARRLHKHYEKGITVSDNEMRALSITTDDTLPKGNHTITPRG